MSFWPHLWAQKYQERAQQARAMSPKQYHCTECGAKPGELCMSVRKPLRGGHYHKVRSAVANKCKDMLR